MQDIYIYNTLSRKKERFVPIKDKQVFIYSCGLTVNNYAHIGHGVAYIMMDSLVKMLAANGYKVKNVMNITDVGHLTDDGDNGDDKIAIAAKKAGKDAYAIAQYFEKYFLDFLSKLNVAKPTIVCRATEHIPEMAQFVKKLLENGYAYVADDGVYFDTKKFANYGKLSNKQLEKQKAGARVATNEQKKSSNDFALWKFVGENTLMKWPNSMVFGENKKIPQFGTPGWHIECSAMSHKYLGEYFDIHTGGVDHIPIHHENEIAQSEAYYGKKTINYWMHCEFLKINNTKMSKSLGNLYKLEDLQDRGFSPLDFRYFVLNANYKKPINFTFDALEGAKTSLQNFYRIAFEHKMSNAKTDKAILNKLASDFLSTISDDLNLAKALGDLWVALKGQKKSVDIYNLLLDCDKVLSLDIKSNVEALQTDSKKIKVIPANVQDLAKQRVLAKQNKDFASADLLRAQVEEIGYTIIDTKDGYELKEK